MYGSERKGVIHIKNLNFDYCAIIIITILLVTTILRRMVKGKLNRCFIELLVVAWLTIFFDIWAVNLDNLGTAQIFSKYVAHMGYLVFHSLAMSFYVVYIIAMTDTWHQFKAKRWYIFLSAFPEFVIVSLTITSPFTKWIFYIDEQYSYVRGLYFELLYVCAAVYMIYGIVYLVLHRRMFWRRHLASIAVAFLAVAAGIFIQYFKPDTLIEMFCMAVSLMVLSFMIQRPEERLEVVTGLDRVTAYMEDMRQAFSTKKPIRIIMVNITNYVSIQELLGYVQCMHAMEQVAAYMVRLDKKMDLRAELYNLEQGKFRFVVEEKRFRRVWDAASEMNRIMKEKFVINQMAVNMITNICIADCPQDISDVDTLMAFGDTLQEIPYTGDIMAASELLKRLHYGMMHDMDAIIEAALSANRFEVYYQPIYSVEEKKFHSAEALIRLKDEKYGFISPEIFIPVAEKSGAIHKIGDFVLEQVCAFIASDEYKKLGLSYIEVNLSVVQCMQPKLANHIMDILTRYGVRPEQLNLEITETAASISQQALEDNIEDLTNMGMKFSLDDFGTGYSNMQRIVKLPFNIIKLDRTFTELYDNPKLGIVLMNTINMIKAMKMKIVVEGVETAEMLKLFSDLECEYIQGYYFSKPIPRSEFVKFIQTSS